MKHVKSDIPQGAIEKTVREHKEKDMLHGYRVVDCFFKGNRVGQRVYNYAGFMVAETPIKDSLKHGREITWNEDGTLLSVEPYVKGKIHGTAKQYGRNGKILGKYTIVHGTGFDIWRGVDIQSSTLQTRSSPNRSTSRWRRRIKPCLHFVKRTTHLFEDYQPRLNDLCLHARKPPNTACTRRVGLAAFSSCFLAGSWFRQSDIPSSRPPAGNAHRWVPRDNPEISKTHQEVTAWNDQSG